MSQKIKKKSTFIDMTAMSDVIKVARNLFFVVAVFEIFDGLQVTALGAL